MSTDFQEYVDGERARLESARAELLQGRRLIDERIANIDDEMRAVAAYERAKTGTEPAAGPKTTRTRRVGRREAIIQALGTSPLGMTRGELLEALSVKGDKSDEMSVSNALTVLRRAGQVTRQEGGRWAIVAAAQLQRAAE